MAGRAWCEVCWTPGQRLVKEDGPGGMTRYVCADAVGCMDRLHANEPDSDWDLLGEEDLPDA